MKLEQLVTVLDQLVKQSHDIDQRRGKHHVALFDERLFQCKAVLLEPCVIEAQTTLGNILREQKEGKLSPPRTEFLTERLIDQVTAIQREIATTRIRSNEPKPHRHTQKPLNDLYQSLAQHQEWEQRLIKMVQSKENVLLNAHPEQRQRLQSELVATEMRLKRCKESKLKIEKQINYRERNQ